MNKRLSVVVAAVLVGAWGGVASAEESAAKIWSVGLDVKGLAGYQWRNHVSNTEGAIQGTLWGSLALAFAF